MSDSVKLYSEVVLRSQSSLIHFVLLLAVAFPVPLAAQSNQEIKLPETLPNIADKLSHWETLGYADLCFEFLKLFVTVFIFSG